REAVPCAAASRFRPQQVCTVVPSKTCSDTLARRHVGSVEHLPCRATGYDHGVRPTWREDGETATPNAAARKRLRARYRLAAEGLRGTPFWHWFRYSRPPKRGRQR